MTYIHLTSISRGTSFLFFLTIFITFSVTPAFAARTYTYDANGNMTSDGEKCYQYNEANQLKVVRNCSNNKLIADYIYDHNGKRIAKKEYTNGVLKRTVYSPDDGFEKVKQASNSAIENTTYYMANTEVLAKKNPDGTKNYHHSDHLGSNTVITDQSGTIVEKTTYKPYGELISGGNKTKFQYTGQEKDHETGLNYYDARYYDPHIRRFTQPDELIQNIYDPQSLNRYAYARNNPLRYTDPTGHAFWDTIVNSYNAFTAKISNIFKPKPAPPVSKYVLPTNNITQKAKVELPSQNKSYQTTNYTTKSTLSDFGTKVMNEGYVDIGGSYTFGKGVSAGGGVKFNNKVIADYVSVGAQFERNQIRNTSGFKVGGDILFSSNPIKEHSISKNMTVSLGLSVQLDDKYSIEAFGFGCCGFEISTEYTGKINNHRSQETPSYRSLPLNEVYNYE